jgi:hypothetical protein
LQVVGHVFSALENAQIESGPLVLFDLEMLGLGCEYRLSFHAAASHSSINFVANVPKRYVSLAAMAGDMRTAESIRARYSIIASIPAYPG